jgi:hypothetical protein
LQIIRQRPCKKHILLNKLIQFLAKLKIMMLGKTERERYMINKEIIYCGQKAIIACDEKCEKAWGIHSRPKIQLSDDSDDYIYLSDSELGEAPINPGTCEMGYAKPKYEEERLNRWCCRECERCYISMPNEFDKPIVLKDFSEKVYNIPRA